MKKVILIVLGIFAVIFISAGITLMSMNKDLPIGTTGSAAEELTNKIEKSIGLAEWKNTQAVEFNFIKRNNRHFRDMKRDLVEVEWDEKPLLFGDQRTYKVQYSNQDRSRYLVWQNAKKYEGHDARELVEQAYNFHTNDFFWLNPYSMLRAPGTIRKFIAEQALLVQFESGGVTPGDSYLVITDENFRPVRLQMWVSILPIKGIEWICESWMQTSQGAWINSKSTGGVITIEITDIKTWARYPEKKEDRFSQLLPLLDKR